MQRLEYKERTNEAEKKLWRLFYAQGTAICFYRLHLDPGDIVNVYTPQAGDQVVDDSGKVNALRTVTVLAPGATSVSIALCSIAQGSGWGRSKK